MGYNIDIKRKRRKNEKDTLRITYAEKGLTVGKELKGTSNPETPKGYYITEYAVSSLAACEKIKNFHKPQIT